ncbi:hypothetical protein A5791_00080 [Mycobacterium sp. 852002-51163_SCH5372311]|uniref:hypothetical protein n=1 Tax=Mycobacterium sp. 852002-51163_SCH5372311 TaxID=1834097 RepID=UPI00080105D3|nr:hypothetical protein [Mycobacterium sp. 852002-51163_SCH5372311]OBF94525.1 hypothetical protein A5791_00080 [Mycobacterium sp. 852002-51163_SCH5372311]
MNQTWLRRCLAILTVALLIPASACNSTPSQPRSTTRQSSAAATTQSTAASATSQTPAQTPTVTGEDLEGTVRALGTVFKPCNSTRNAFDAAKVFDPQTGRMVVAPTPPPLPPGTELAFGRGNPAYFCTLTGTPTDLKIFYVWTYRTPSHGLEPERFTLMAGVGGINDKSITKVAELPAELGGSPSKVYSTAGGPVLSYCCRTSGVSTAAIDPETLTVRWTSPHNLASVEESTVAFHDVSKSIVTIRDVASGAEVVLDHADPAGPKPLNYELDSGYVIRQTKDEVNLGDFTWGYYSVIAHKFYPNLITAGTLIDPIINEGKLLIRSTKNLKILDIANGTVLFEMSPDEMRAVNSYQFGTSGDYLYIGNQSDSPVIDIRDRKQVSSGWKVRPLDFFGKSWVLVDHRAKTAANCYEGPNVFTCGGTKDVVIQRIDNGVYPGPWY